MNLGDIKRQVKNIVGDEAGILIEDVDLLDYVNNAQVDIARKTGILRKSVVFATVAATAEYPAAIGTDFIEAKRLSYLGSKLSPTTIEELDMLDPDREVTSNTGTPTHWYMWGKTIGLYPTPVSSVANACKLHYIYAPAALVNDNDIPELPIHMHEDIVRYVIMRAKEQIEDLEAAKSIQKDLDVRIGMSKAQSEPRSGASYPAVRDIETGYW